MKNQDEMLPKELFDLFSAKSYEELSCYEKDLVNQHMKQDEYDDYVVSIMSFQTMDESITVPKLKPPEVKRKYGIIKSIWFYKLPFYQVAAACLIFSLATSILLQQSRNNESTRAPQSSVSVGVNSKTLNEKAIARHLNEIKLVVNNRMTQGKSIAIDHYPKDLIFEY